MIRTHELINLIVSTGSLFGLWFLYFKLYRDYRTDLFRQRLFRLRDDLFEEARRGALSFDDPSYRMLRGLLNGYIRFAHRVSFLSFVFFAWSYEPAADSTSALAEWNRELSKHKGDSRKLLEKYHQTAHLLLIDQVVFTSFFLAVAALTMILALGVKRVLKERDEMLGIVAASRVLRWPRSIRRSIERQADEAALVAHAA